MTALARRLALDPRGWRLAELKPAVDWLRGGGVVAFPTDTFYGLAVDPASDAAVAALFDLKGRAASAAVPLVGASVASVRSLVGPMSPATVRLAEALWPGPLSLLIDTPPGIAAGVDGGTGAIAVRVPDHPVACAIAGEFGGLLTATSANMSGAPAVASAADLGSIAADPRVFVVHAGTTPGGAASTIVDARRVPPVLVRAGAMAWDRVLKSLNG